MIVFAEAKLENFRYTNEDQTKAFIKAGVPIYINFKHLYKFTEVRTHLNYKGTFKHKFEGYVYKKFRFRNQNYKLKKKLSHEFGIKIKNIELNHNYQYFENLGIEVQYVSSIIFKGSDIKARFRKNKIKKLLEEWES